MQFLANENLPMASVRLLRQADFSVTAIVESSPGITDKQVLAIACNEKRVILTFDRDYGDLIYRKKLPTPEGLVYFRFTPQNPEEPAKILLWALGQNIALSGKFTIIEREKIRQKPL